LSSDGSRLFVANANSDTVSVIATPSGRVVETIGVRPDSALPFGSAPNALALDESRGLLYVANGGNNALAVVELHADKPSHVTGFVPTAWYPGALSLDGDRLLIANVKGVGSRTRNPNSPGWNSKNHRGSAQRISLTSALRDLPEHTRTVLDNGYLPQVLRALERSSMTDKPPVPVPAKLGESSVIEHVVYVIKENRTYDQVLGDLPQGNGDPDLCIYPREITPNHHALAEQFVLLDNWYCNGVNSADGHAWSTEGYVTDYLEKSFGGFTRSYTWGNDALSYASSGFFWDNVLAHGLSFRNFGEMDYTEPVPKSAQFAEIYDDFIATTGKISFKHRIGIKRLATYSSPDYPGWNMRIPDVLRASIFIRDLEAFEKKGHFPNFTIIYLPQNHTSGTSPGAPTPAAHVADNDLALGRVVEAISNSSFWPKTAIFVVEDDPQDGFDHVDGHRSVCLVISPYTQHGRVVSNFYNQTSVLHTMARILGLPPLNQIDAAAPLMAACFRDTPNLAAYTAIPNDVPLNQLNPRKNALAGDALMWAEKSMEQNFELIDAGDEDTLNRILWHAAKGTDTPYPTHLSGAHGMGLADLNLVLDTARADADDD
jgi:YVTN family beta-propeller protein